MLQVLHPLTKVVSGEDVSYSGLWDWSSGSDVQCSENSSRTVFQFPVLQWDLSVGRLEWCLPNTANRCFLHLVRLVVGYFVRSLTDCGRQSSLFRCSLCDCIFQFLKK